MSDHDDLNARAAAIDEITAAVRPWLWGLMLGKSHPAPTYKEVSECVARHGLPTEDWGHEQDVALAAIRRALAERELGLVEHAPA